MSQLLSFAATLTQPPYAAERIETGHLPPQVITESDFAAYRSFAKPDWAPVLVSFEQKYRFMDALLARIRGHLDGQFDLILMTCRVPGVIRFPTAFNAEDIFKVAELEPEATRLRARGLRVLTLHEGLVRHPMELGRNELALTLNSDATAAFAAFVADLQATWPLQVDPSPSRPQPQPATALGTTAPRRLAR